MPFPPTSPRATPTPPPTMPPALGPAVAGAGAGSAAPTPDIEDSAFGSVAVTDACCGAMTCRVLAPSIFLEAKDASSAQGPNFTTVAGRPIQDETEYRQVHRAAAACPFDAIRMTKGAKGKALEAVGGDVNASYPFPVSTKGDVLLLGHYSPKNAGASCYLIKRPKGGHVMVDAPEPNPTLIARIKEELGQVKFLVFTHKDHTAFSAAWAEAFPGLRRVMHHADVVHAPVEGDGLSLPYTGDVEVQVAGTKPQPLDAEGDVLLVPLPGHTAGSLAVLYRSHYLFTGDSLHWSVPRNHLVASRLQCWGDWAQQARSLRTLLDLPFRHVLPGRGEPMAFPSVDAAHAALRAGLAWMDTQPGGKTRLSRFLAWVALRTTAPSTHYGAWAAHCPRWLRAFAEALLAPPGAPGTRRRDRVYKTLQAAVALWLLYRLLPRLARWLLRMRMAGGKALRCRLAYSAYLVMGGGKARAMQSRAPSV